MSTRTLAARYARALLDVASKESVDVERVSRELGEFSAFLGGQPALERLLMNPAVPAPRKRGALVEITKLAGLSTVLSKLLVMLAERDRLALLNDLIAAYNDMLADRQNVVRAEVTSAEPLPQARIDAIAKKLGDVTGKRVSMTARIDRDIIGGVVARVGTTVYDASIATQLRKIRERLTT